MGAENIEEAISLSSWRPWRHGGFSADLERPPKGVLAWIVMSPLLRHARRGSRTLRATAALSPVGYRLCRRAGARGAQKVRRSEPKTGMGSRRVRMVTVLGTVIKGGYHGSTPSGRQA